MVVTTAVMSTPIITTTMARPGRSERIWRGAGLTGVVVTKRFHGTIARQHAPFDQGRTTMTEAR